MTNQDEEMLLPVPYGFRHKATPEMIVPNHDFGPTVGIHDAIRLHDLWLLMDITDEQISEIDAARKAKGLPPMFQDPEE